MTYGEAYITEQFSLTLEQGKWKQTVYIQNKAAQMQREDAAKYYNKKFFNYWVEHLEFENIKKTKNKKKAVAMLMFGHHKHTHRMGE